MTPQARALVLIVDDEPGIRLVLTGLLEQEGFRTMEAATASDALAVSRTEPVDVVITDLQMPGEDGLWLLQKLRSELPFIPVLLMTAYASVDNAVAAMRLGAFDFLTKPIDRDELRCALAKAVPLSDRLSQQGAMLDLVAQSSAMRDVIKLCERMARSHAPVLITGPSGVGKEVVAKTLHRLAGDPDRPFVAVNCAAIPEALLESELFGHTKGAFTGATCDKPGRVELAVGGILFLDEIGDVSAAVQVKLLRLVQERTYERVGGLGTKHADLRIVAATHRDLEAMVREGTFREDLFFRLNVLPISIPPLRERPDDVAPLAQAFLARAAEQGVGTAQAFDADALAFLARQPWPGNARELSNLVERVAVLCPGPRVTLAELESCLQLGQRLATSMASGPRKVAQPEDERQSILDALEQAGGRRTLAAKLLGVSRRTLYNKLERYAIS